METPESQIAKQGLQAAVDVEAHILDEIYDMVLSVPIPREEWIRRGAVGASIREVVHLDNSTFEIAIDNLYRLRLCSPPSTTLEFIDQPQQKFQLQMKEIICLTELGFAFVSACRPPIKTGQTAHVNRRK